MLTNQKQTTKFDNRVTFPLPTTLKPQYPKIDEAAILEHYRELQRLKPRSKHPVYNSLLRLFRKAGINVTTLNNSSVICSGLLQGMMFRPDETRCKVFISQNMIYGTSKIHHSWDFEISYSPECLFVKMLYHNIITTKTYELLMLHLSKTSKQYAQ